MIRLAVVKAPLFKTATHLTLKGKRVRGQMLLPRFRLFFHLVLTLFSRSRRGSCGQEMIAMRDCPVLDPHSPTFAMDLHRSHAAAVYVCMVGCTCGRVFGKRRLDPEHPSKDV